MSEPRQQSTKNASSPVDLDEQNAGRRDEQNADEQNADEQHQTGQSHQAEGGEGSTVDAAAAGSNELEELRSRLQRADKDVLIAQAELENFRKRTRRDLELQVRYAVVPLLQDILQVRDNLHRALEAAGGSEGESNGLRDGVAMVAKMLDDTLSKHGCTPIPGVGEKFDPNIHEAISQVPSDEHPEGVIAHEAVKGFQLHDRVVRPSQVVVSTGPANS